MHRLHPSVIGFGTALAMASSLAAQTYTLDDPASPISVQFNGASARMSVTVKQTGAVWSNPSAGGGTAMSVTGVIQTDATHLTVAASASGGPALTISLVLDPPTGELSVTLSADPAANISGSLRYPYAFFPPDGSGSMVMPVFGGYVVPTTQTSWIVPSGHSRLEWFGGVDAAFEGGWMMIAAPAPAADMELGAETVTVNGQSRRAGVFKWDGSNANPGALANRFSYDRTAILRFFARGGYVAQAKRFREYARQQGWLVTLRDKAAANPDVDRMVGAPILYLWGDGRSMAMLDGLYDAGLRRAMVQVSINHVDHNNAFPNQTFAGSTGWTDAVRAKGFVPGIYDIYARYSAQQTQPPFNGFSYLWPSIANPQWIYRNADGTLDNASSINNALAAVFARDTRLPAHNAMFGFDAYFSDVVCAVMPREDFDTSFGHAMTRAQDIAGRQALLAAVSSDHHKLAGVEQMKSWAIPVSHWGEGVFWLGGNPSSGAWNNNAYPEIMTDVKDPTAAQLPALLDVGFRVPLFDLVYHDCIVATVHWHRPHNKHLYAWDLADQFALLRGQAPLINLVYNGDQGSIGRTISGATDARDGTLWDSRWTNPRVRDRVVRTYNTVCAWHRAVGYLEMTDCRPLTSDLTVQLSEFTDDARASGQGIVVNFGHYDGAFGMTGSTWSGTIRGIPLSVPVGGYATYEFNTCPADINRDTLLSVQDIFDFLAAYFGAQSAADFNGQGGITVQDIFDSLAAYFNGCG